MVGYKRENSVIANSSRNSGLEFTLSSFCPSVCVCHDFDILFTSDFLLFYSDSDFLLFNADFLTFNTVILLFTYFSPLYNVLDHTNLIFSESLGTLPKKNRENVGTGGGVYPNPTSIFLQF